MQLASYTEFALFSTKLFVLFLAQMGTPVNISLKTSLPKPLKAATFLENGRPTLQPFSLGASSWLVQFSMWLCLAQALLPSSHLSVWQITWDITWSTAAQMQIASQMLLQRRIKKWPLCTGSCYWSYWFQMFSRFYGASSLVYLEKPNRAIHGHNQELLFV